MDGGSSGSFTTLAGEGKTQATTAGPATTPQQEPSRSSSSEVAEVCEQDQETPLSIGLSVVEPWFTHIAQGRKTVEGRLASERYRALAPGSRINFARGQQESAGKEEARVQGVAEAVVTKVVNYPTIRAYLQEEGLAACLPGVATVEEGVQVYRQFYTAEEEQRKGVVAIHINCL